MADIPTPSVVVDLVVAQRNIDRLADYARRHGLALRPHCKTHKSLAMARRQMQAGAVGLTVSKLGEAEVMAQATEDLLIAYPAWDSWRACGIAKLARDRTLRVAVDSVPAVDALAAAARGESSTVGIMVELDVGHRRTGVGSPQEALALAQHVDQATGVRLDGIMFFPGHVRELPDQQGPVLGAIGELIAGTKGLWQSSGLPLSIVSGGSTPTALQSHLISDLTEIRPGTYIYYDRKSINAGCCTAEDCAAKMLCTVVSDAVSGNVVIDAGSKSLSTDSLAGEGEQGGFGLVVGYPEARIVRLNEEHGMIDVASCPRRPRLGQRLWVIPNHICTCVNLQEKVWCTSDGENVEALGMEARGKVW